MGMVREGREGRVGWGWVGLSLPPWENTGSTCYYYKAGTGIGQFCGQVWQAWGRSLLLPVPVPGVGLCRWEVVGSPPPVLVLSVPVLSCPSLG